MGLLSFILVPLATAGVRIRPLPCVGPDPFYEVILDDVGVDGSAVLGPEGGGWALLSKALSLERTGVDYYVKAQRWYEQTWQLASANRRSANTMIDLARAGARLEIARLFSYRTVRDLSRGRLAERDAAIAKWLTSEVAAEIAWTGHRVQGLNAWLANPSGQSEHGELAKMYLEAPGLLLSAGSSEMMLETVARTLFDDDA